MERSHVRQAGYGRISVMSVLVAGLLLAGEMNNTASAETAIASAKPVLDSSIGSYQTTTPVSGRMAIAISPRTGRFSRMAVAIGQQSFGIVSSLNVCISQVMHHRSLPSSGSRPAKSAQAWFQ